MISLVQSESDVARNRRTRQKNTTYVARMHTKGEILIVLRAAQRIYVAQRLVRMKMFTFHFITNFQGRQPFICSNL